MRAIRGLSVVALLALGCGGPTLGTDRRDAGGLDAAGLRDAASVSADADLPPADAGPPDAPPSETGPLPGADAGTDEMITIPAGPFYWGCNSIEHCYPDEEPYRQISLSSYLIDRTEVTRAAYRNCVDAGGCSGLAGDDLSTRLDHPIAGVTWDQADAFCRFRGAHLPTGAQWERAARSTDGRTYPWGNALPTCADVNAMACVGDTTPVGSYPSGASDEGVLDLLGNVWEWNADWYSETSYADAPDLDPPGPASGPGHIYRGGAYPADVKRLDTWLRYFPDDTAGDIRRRERTGFRCAR